MDKRKRTSQNKSYEQGLQKKKEFTTLDRESKLHKHRTRKD